MNEVAIVSAVRTPLTDLAGGWRPFVPMIWRRMQSSRHWRAPGLRVTMSTRFISVVQIKQVKTIETSREWQHFWLDSHNRYQQLL